MAFQWRIWFWLLFCGLGISTPLKAQLPFYTDDPGVTDEGKFHFEFFNEFDSLAHGQYPNLKQNTANYKLNYGLPHNLELDVDAPYLAIFRALGVQTSTGVGDLDMGLKWNFHQATPASRVPALAVAFYVEFPTGDSRQQLGSGLSDYWLYIAAQKPLTDKTRINANLGFLFAGNTSTGVVGVTSTRGHVYTGGVSLLHDFTPRLTLGGEVYGGIDDQQSLGLEASPGHGGRSVRPAEWPGSCFWFAGRKIHCQPKGRRSGWVCRRLPRYFPFGPKKMRLSTPGRTSCRRARNNSSTFASLKISLHASIMSLRTA